jgi:hypothetical protein
MIQRLIVCLLVLSGAWAQAQTCAELFQTQRFVRDAQGRSIAIKRIESLMGHQTEVLDVSASVIETRSKEDPKLRIVNLGKIFESPEPFLGFGMPNVYLALPGQDPVGHGYVKVSAKSLKRADTKIERTLDRAQSGIFLTLPAESTERLLEAAKKYEGTRSWTCVNTNCQIMADAGFTIGGENLANYYFPVPLLKDIMNHGLELDGKPISFELVKTTPGFLEDIGLSISHAVTTTVCRHSTRTCGPIKKRILENTWLVKVNDGIKKTFGIAFIKPKTIEPIDKPKLEVSRTTIEVSPELESQYSVEVSQPSRLGLLFRLIFGPHSLFEIPISKDLVDAHLPDILKEFPDANPSLTTSLKQHLLFSPPVISLIRGLIQGGGSQRIEGLNQSQLLDMMRTDSEKIPNRYNFVIAGDKITFMKLNIFNSIYDWILAKHVLLSGYSQDVRFAGEIRKTADGIIRISGNSGTYKPKPESLLKLKTFVEVLFPGVHIVME